MRKRVFCRWFGGLSLVLCVAISLLFFSDMSSQQLKKTSLGENSPIIMITGVENGAWYNHDVVPVIKISGKDLDDRKTIISLNNQSYAPKTPITAENFYLLFISAEDISGNNAQKTMYFVIDKTPPKIRVEEPYAQTRETFDRNGRRMEVKEPTSFSVVVGKTPYPVSGRLEDISPEALSVNGKAASISGGGDFTIECPLSEGLNILKFVANDKAQNEGTFELRMALKTTKPEVMITEPPVGTVTSSDHVDLKGKVSKDAVKVIMDREEAFLKDSSFFLPNRDLKPGGNTLTVTAVDTAGNEGQASLMVERDDAPPKIRVESPGEPAHTSRDSITVKGTIKDSHSFKAELNGNPLEVQGGTFSKEMPILPGRNAIVVSAVDVAGNRSSEAITVTRTPGTFKVLTSEPPDGKSGAYPRTPVLVTFNNDVKPASLMVSSFIVSVEGRQIPGIYFADGNKVRFVPSSEYPPTSVVSVSLTSVITDRSNTSLQPYSFTFNIKGKNDVGLDMDRIEAFVIGDRIKVTGKTGSAAGYGSIHLVNQARPEAESELIQVNPDGSFEGSVRGMIIDTIEIHAFSQNGHEETCRPELYVSEDRKNVFIGPGGGSFTFRENGGAVIGSVVVLEGTFDSFSMISMEKANVSEAAKTPEGLWASDPLKITLNGWAKKGIRIAVPLQAGMKEEPSWLVKSVKWGDHEKVSPMFIDTMDVVDLEGGRRLINGCDNFSGLLSDGIYQVYQSLPRTGTEGSPEKWGFLTGKYIVSDYQSDNVIFNAKLTPFVWFQDFFCPSRYFLPVPLPQGRSYELKFHREFESPRLLKEDHDEIPLPDGIVEVGTMTDIDTNPYPSDGTPFRVIPFTVPAYRKWFTDPRITCEMAFASQPELSIIGAYGLFYQDDGNKKPSMKLEIGKSTVYADTLPEGNFYFKVPTELITSGTQVKVYDPAGKILGELEGGIPEMVITSGLKMRIEKGVLLLKFGDDLLGRTGALYNAKNGVVKEDVFPYKQLVAEESLAGKAINAGDALFLAVSGENVDLRDGIKIRFDRDLKKDIPPIAVNSAADPARAQSVMLKEIEGGVVPVDLELLYGRDLKINPKTALLPGKQYEMLLYGFINDAGRNWPLDRPLEFRFSTCEPSFLAEKRYNRVDDMVRRGSVLYLALGDDGYDILDVSDPQHPASLLKTPISTKATMRRVAIAGNISIKEGSTAAERNVLVLLGEEKTRGGVLNLYYGDEPDAENKQPQSIGTFIAGTSLFPAFPEGAQHRMEIAVSDNYAVVSACGMGIRIVDLTRIQNSEKTAVISRVTSFRDKDISSALTSLGIFSVKDKRFVIGAIKDQGLALWSLNNGTLDEKGFAEFPPCTTSCSGEGVVTLEAYKTLENGREMDYQRNFAFVSAGTAGILVYELTSRGEIKLAERIPLAGCSGVSVDKERRIVYAAGLDGISVIDASNPVQPDNVCEIIDENKDNNDDRILGRLAVEKASSQIAPAVDGSTGLLYIVKTGRVAGIAIKSVAWPRIDFLVNGQPDKEYLSAFDNDRAQLALWINGGAGEKISDNAVRLYDRKGFPEEPTRDEANKEVHSTVARNITLQRQSNKKTDEKYNLYLQSPEEKLVLMMNYNLEEVRPPDPEVTLSDLMVTRQGGTLRAAVNAKGWWGDALYLRKVVSRPWVGWVGDRLIDEDEENEEDYNE